MLLKISEKYINYQIEKQSKIKSREFIGKK